MALAFIDTEFTGEHQHATLVSLAIVKETRFCQPGDDEALYVALNDYDEAQVTPWLRDNVLSRIEDETRISSAVAYERVAHFLGEYEKQATEAGGRDDPRVRISLVSAGKMLDVQLLFELYRFAPQARASGVRFFHALHHLPPYLNHAAHFDVPTLMALAGFDPDMNREHLLRGLGQPLPPGARHEALHDARVVRALTEHLLRRAPLVPRPTFEHADASIRAQ